MPLKKGVTKMREKLNRYLFLICAYLLAIMVAEATWQVLSRYIFNSPSSWTDEILRFQLIWLSMIGAPLAHGLNRQMAVTIFTDRFSKKSKATNILIVESIVFVFAFIVLVIGGLKVAINANTQISPSMGINMFYIYFSMPVSGVLFMLYSGQNILVQLKQNKEVK